MSPTDRPDGRPTWIVVLAVLGIFIVVCAVVIISGELLERL